MEEHNCSNCGSKECANTGMDIISYCAVYVRASVKPEHKTIYRIDKVVHTFQSNPRSRAVVKESQNKSIIGE